MSKGYYITKSGERVTLKSAKTINVSNKDIIELVLPEGVHTVWCDNNQLTTLTLPEGVQTVSCHHNQLTTLTLPEGVKERLAATNNQLTTLTLPEGVKDVYCDDLILDVNKYLDKEINININCR